MRTMDLVGRQESSSFAVNCVATVFGAEVAGEDKGRVLTRGGCE